MKVVELRFALIAFVTLVMLPSTAEAYIDPGMVSMVVQGLFAVFAGLAATFIIAPWRWLKSLFGKIKPVVQKNEPDANADQGEN